MGRNQRKRARRRRIRIGLKILEILIIAVMVVGLGGLGVWMLLDHEPETVTTCVVKYEDLIRKYASENGLDPAYVAAVVMAESSYRPEAVSSVNAQGLMQIMPDTGQWLAGKFDEEYVEGCLFDPGTNLKYGCWYLSFLMRRYDNDMRCASAGYHAGQGTVDKWLKNPDYSADGRTLRVIPYDSTNTYVERILRYYEEYRKIYA